MEPALQERVLEFDRATKDVDETVDAVVVGTGCGGAVVAKELAGAGWSVLMLERGGLYLAARGDFDQREDDMMAKIDGGRGLDTTAEGQLALTYGNNVGGASVHYWAETYRTPEDRCELWASRFGVQHRSHAELLPWFERIEKDLSVHPAGEDKKNRMNWLFEKGAKAIGVQIEKVTQARKPNCIGSGYCMQGCAYDAKQSQLVTYVPEALSKGARIFADCQADRILVEDGAAVGVAASFLDRRTGKPSGVRCRVRARKAVVVAAGGFNTAPLLMRSEIPDLSGELGKNLQANPCAQAFALFDEDVILWRGIPAAIGSQERRLAQYDEKGRYLGGGYLLHPNQLPPAMLAALLPGFGKPHRALMAQAHRIGSVISWIDESGTGRVELDRDGAPVWHFRLEGDDVRKVKDALKLQARILLAAGAREVIIPDPPITRIRDERELSRIDEVDTRPGSMMFAAPHPAGACRMGGRPSDSVVDSNGECWAVQRLFVADPSAFPTVVSVDPSETIMAWSYVTAHRMLARG